MLPINKITDLFRNAVVEATEKGQEVPAIRITRMVTNPNGGFTITINVLPASVAVKLDPTNPGTRFLIKGTMYEVLGSLPRSYKYSISAKRLRDGRRFKVTPSAVIEGFIQG